MKSDKLVCMSKTVFYFGCVILFLIVYLIIDKLNKKDECICPVLEKEDKKNVVLVDRPTQIIDRQIVDRNDSPQQFRRGPERYYMGRGLPINIRTRGEPYEYQNIGTLTNASGNNDVKPLYGRRTYGNSNLWNYYTLLNNHIQVKQEIEIDSNNCLEERGCRELMDGQNINVNGVSYTVNLYPYSDFRYIPFI